MDTCPISYFIFGHFIPNLITISSRSPPDFVFDDYFTKQMNRLEFFFSTTKLDATDIKISTSVGKSGEEVVPYETLLMSLSSSFLMY